MGPGGPSGVDGTRGDSGWAEALESMRDFSPNLVQLGKGQENHLPLVPVGFPMDLLVPDLKGYVVTSLP